MSSDIFPNRTWFNNSLPYGADSFLSDVDKLTQTKLEHGGPSDNIPPGLRRNIKLIAQRNPVLTVMEPSSSTSIHMHTAQVNLFERLA